MAQPLDLPFEDSKAGRNDGFVNSPTTPPKSDVKQLLDKEASKSKSLITTITEKIGDSEKQIGSVLLALWEQKNNSTGSNEVNKYTTIIEDLKKEGDKNIDDIILRFKNKRHDPAKGEILGDQKNEVAPYPKEEFSIEGDLKLGRVSYDRSSHQNKYTENNSGNGKDNYVYAFKSFSANQTGAIATNVDIEEAQKEGYNLGQVRGGIGWNTRFNIFKNTKPINKERYQNLVNEWRVNNFSLDSESDASAGQTARDIYKSLLPGVARLPINFYYKLPLELLLEQNQLQPSTGGFLSDRLAVIAGEPKFLYGFFTKSADIQKSWNNLYKRNNDAPGFDEQARRGTDETFPRGTISRQDVLELQEPRHDKKGNPIDGTGVISYEADAKYHTYTTRHRGFYSNITGNVMELDNKKPNDEKAPSAAGGGGLLSAIEQISHDKNQANESLISAAGQYFPFLFETVNRSLDPSTGGKTSEIYEQFAYFQGTLGQLSEQYSPEWSSTHFVGRSEDTHTYVKGSRTIDIRFVVFANSARELQNVYERTNWLAQQTYPLYDINPAKQRGGPIIRITIGDLLRQVGGFIRNLSFNWDFLGVNKWEIERGLQMPMACEISMSFQVIHNFMPDRDTDFYDGLRDKMLTGGQYRSVATSDFTGGAWSSETNMIPIRETNAPEDEQFVNLIARKSLRNQGSEIFNMQIGGTNRSYMPGESFSFADLAALTRGQTVPQVGESVSSAPEPMADQAPPAPPPAYNPPASDLPDRSPRATIKETEF